MATPGQIAKIVKYRGLGYSQQEIADAVDLSRQAVAYQLKKIKLESQELGIDQTFEKTSRFVKPDSSGTEEAREMIRILDWFETDKKSVPEEQIKEAILSLVASSEDWVPMPAIHFKLASTFLDLEGPPSSWEGGWPARLSEKLGFSESFEKEIFQLMGTLFEFEGMGTSTLTRVRATPECKELARKRVRDFNRTEWVKIFSNQTYGAVKQDRDET
ncbi:uncharacterized protein METZ01_LOCUS172028 [marine metagenome]|uniref:Uncharacterized protein n=1 Tax=marine metagenome TaxID=408172 RepID=A0A382BZW7_9ZZZZ